MYNKNQFKKTNNKKILHKVKKQWVTISLALLMMIGGGAVATHVSANADTTTNAKPQVTSNAPQSNSASSITDQAKALHNNMLRNAGLSQAKPAVGATKVGATQSANAPKVVKTAKWDNANVNYYNNDVMELTGNGSINAKDVPNLPKDNYGDVNNDWTLKIDKANASINLDNSAKGGQFSANYNPIWNKFENIDLSGLHTNNVTNMNSMFEGDEYLKNADLSGFNTSNVTNMDYMFSGDVELSSLNLSNFDTRKASTTKFFNQDNNLMALSLGDSTKLNSAFNFLPMKSIYNTNTEIGDFYSSDYGGTIQASELYNYYPINKDSVLLLNNTYGTSASLFMDANGNDVTSKLQNNSLPAGQYYIAKPVSLNFVTQFQNPNNSSKYSDTVHEGVFYPLTNTYTDSKYSINPSSINFNPQINNILSHDKTYYHDYTITSNNYPYTTADPSGLESDGFPAINIKINLNASKYLNDANNNVKSYLNRDQMYQNELNNITPYESSDFNNRTKQTYNSDVKRLNSDYTTTSHNLTEPSDARTIESTSSADNFANGTENAMASNLARFATVANTNRSYYTQEIGGDKETTNTTINDIKHVLQHPYFDMNKLNASSKAILASDANVANSASDTLRTTNWTPTHNNMMEINNIMRHTGSALNDINHIAASAGSSKASSVTPSSTSSKASSKASSATSKASSKASKSVAPSSKTSTNSSKASSSVAPSSTSSNTSSETSSSANSSASSQSSNQSSEASQSSNSSVAPSSAQQPSDNSADNTPFVPSVNVPTTPSTPVVTPTQNNTTSMSNNNNSSVEPQTTNTTVNANTNSQVSDSTKPMVNKHHNARVARNHNAKRGSIYLFNTDFKGLSKRNRSVVTIKGVRAYKRTRKGRYVPVKNIKPNTKLAVKRVIKFGKITKLQLTNGWLVTSNKHFVSVKKFAKRAIKGIDASRYTRALRKSSYVLRHGRRHATRYIYRTAKKFNKTNNAEKKAYRKFTRKHTNRNRKSLNKVLTNLNNLVNALLK